MLAKANLPLDLCQSSKHLPLERRSRVNCLREGQKAPLYIYRMYISHGGVDIHDVITQIEFVIYGPSPTSRGVVSNIKSRL